MRAVIYSVASVSHLVDDLEESIRTARGAAPADLLLRGGRVVNVFTHEIVETAVALRGDRVVGLGDLPAREIIDLEGRYVCPGLIDAHVHIEISMLPPHRFADAVLPHGVTTVVCDPHEIANVLGVRGRPLHARRQRGARSLGARDGAVVRADVVDGDVGRGTRRARSSSRSPSTRACSASRR